MCDLLHRKSVQDPPTLPSGNGTHINLSYLLGPSGVRNYLELWSKREPGREIGAAENYHPQPSKKGSQKVERIVSLIFWALRSMNNLCASHRS